MQQTIDSLQEIRTLAMDFARERLRPNVERWDHDGAFDPDTMAAIAESGFTGMLVPERYGGLDLGLPTFGTTTEALAWGEAAAAFCVVANTAVAATLATASPDEQSRAIEAVAAGAPVDLPLASAALNAKRDGDGWRLDGELTWVLRTGEGSSVLAPGTSEAGPLLFWIQAEEAGAMWTREATLGLRAARFGRIAFHNVAARGETCIARGPAADAAMRRGLDVTRFGAAAIATGIARAALEHAIGYAAEREQFRRRLREFEGIQVKLADIAVHVAAARALLMEGASGDADAIAVAKLFASEAATFVTREAVQIFGGYGYMRDYPVEKLMRDAKATEILCTTNEDLRVSIAAGLYDT